MLSEASGKRPLFKKERIPEYARFPLPHTRHFCGHFAGLRKPLLYIVCMCITVAPRSPRHGLGPHGARHCADTEQRCSPCPKEFTIEVCAWFAFTPLHC